jgi:amidophosphoribosyltransferase
MRELNEKCAIFGVYGKGMDAARLTYFGLFALQHRGQESSGITASDGKKIRAHKGSGLVPQVYSEKNFKKLKGYIAIGHNRYSTSGGSVNKHSQPVCGANDIFSLAHNGNLPSTKILKSFLRKNNIPINGLNDSGLMHAAIKYYLRKNYSLKDAVTEAFPLFTGAFSLLVMTRDEIAIVRDQFGIRPLSIGKLNGGYIFSSETCAIDTINAKFVRDVKPGELVIANEKGLHSYQLAKSIQKLDIFEFIYFSRPDSTLLGKRVHDVRKNLGRELAMEYPIKADVVIPVPDSAIPAAIGYSNARNIPIDFGLVKNRYIGRTFIMPDQKLRDKSVEMKLNPIREVVEGKIVALIDDSIVRGTTANKLVKMVRNAGAKKVYLLSSCPPIRFPDFYGIDTPNQSELIAANMSIKNVEKFIGADKVCYLSYEGMIRATGLSKDMFCTSQFTGEYPIDIGENRNNISYSFKK